MRDDEPHRRRGGGGDHRERRERGGGGGGGDRSLRVVKFLCPNSLVASLMGSGGGILKKIEQDTGARLKFSGRDEYFPNTECRVIVASAREPQQIMTFIDILIQKTVTEVGKGGGKNKSDILVGKDRGEIVVRMAMPKSCTGAIIGPKGQRIKDLRDNTGAKVFVENDSFDMHQMVRIVGTPESIMKVAPGVLDYVDSEMSEDFMRDWERMPNFNGGNDKGDGKGKGSGKGSRRDEGKGKDEERRGRSRSRSRGKGGGKPRGRSSRNEGREEEDGAAMNTEVEALDDSPLPFFDNSLEAITKVSEEIEPNRLGLDHAVSCDLPSECVAALCGQNSHILQAVKEATGASVTFEQSTTGTSHRTLMIQGPLLACYAAHLLMMKRFHMYDAREEERRARREEEARKREEERRARREEEDRRIRQEEEDQRNAAAAEGGGDAGGAAVDAEDPDQVEALQAQLKQLQEQLAAVQRSGKGKGGGGKGGKRR